MANAFQNSPQQQQQQQQQICYSNASSASNNLISMHSNFSPNFGETNSFEPMHQDHEEEEETHDPIEFANNIFQWYVWIFCVK